MSQQGPIVVIATVPRPEIAEAIAGGGAFPVLEVSWADAASAIENIKPNVIIADISDASNEQLTDIAKQALRAEPYLPLITLGVSEAPPENALPFDVIGETTTRLQARLNAALRVRSLHATVLRRLSHQPQPLSPTPAVDLLQDATVLLVGRGAAYPALSVAIGERMGVIGALSVEAAARHLNVRDIDGIVLGEGFSPRVADAFLTVLSEDTRFRNLPIVVCGSCSETAIAYQSLPNLEIVRRSPAQVVANAIPLIRQHALEALLSRTLKSLDAGGLLDARTGLLTTTAFDIEFTKALAEAAARGNGLSAARFWFEDGTARTGFDAARILGRLMRQVDFAVLQDDNSVIAVFTETDLRTAHVITRRLASVLKHTVLGSNHQSMTPSVTLATLKADDSAETLLMRLRAPRERAAS